MKSLRVIKAIGWRCSERASKSLTHWLAELRILRLLSREKPHVDTVTCLKLTPDLARAQRRDLGEEVDRYERPRETAKRQVIHMTRSPSTVRISVPVEDESTLREVERRVREVTLEALRDAGVAAPDVEMHMQYSEVMDDGVEVVGCVWFSIRGVAATKEAKVMAALVAEGFDPGQHRPKAVD
jgi:hypothetical protein